LRQPLRSVRSRIDRQVGPETAAGIEFGRRGSSSLLLSLPTSQRRDREVRPRTEQDDAESRPVRVLPRRDQCRARTRTSHGAQASRVEAGCALFPTFGRLCCFGIRQLPTPRGCTVGGTERSGGAGAFAMRLWLRWIVAAIVFALVVVGATIWTTEKFDAAKQARIAAEDSDEIVVDSIYSDRIEGQYDPDYDRSRYRTIAKSFETDPIFLDGYRAFSADDADLETIRTEVDGLDVPTHVAILSNSELDDADGDADLLAARIAAELSDERATVLVVGLLDEGIGSTGANRDLRSRPRTDPDKSASAVAVDYVRALKSTEAEDATTVYSSKTDDEGRPIVVNEDTS